MRVDKSARVSGQTRARTDESSKSLTAHESRRERMRVIGQTRARADKSSKSLKAHES